MLLVGSLRRDVPARTAIALRALLFAIVIWPMLLGLRLAAHRHGLAWDFTSAYLPAAHRVVHGQSPLTHLTQSNTPYWFVYPPLTAYLFTPFTLITTHVANLVVTVLVLAAMPVALAVVGVR